MVVRRTPERVWIEGVEGFNPGDFASSVHGCDARILQALGEPLAYDDLVCYSGFAFRIAVHKTMCPSAGHPCCGFPCIENGVRALPWKTRSFALPSGGKPGPARAAFEADVRAAIRTSIDRGMPVHYGSEEDGLIIGYADNGGRWWCLHPYHKGGREAFWHDQATGFAGGQWPWGITVWTEPKPEAERCSGRVLTLAALKQAVEMWGAGKRQDYFVGDAAYGHWLQWLRDVDAGKAADPRAGMQGNGWCYDVLIRSRCSAGAWLKRKADGFNGEGGWQLRIAAQHEAAIADLGMRGLKCAWDLAPGPDRVNAWTPALRREQIARLEAAREHDRAAIAALTAALASLREP